MDSIVYFSFVPFYAIIISLVGAILILITGKWPNIREVWTIAAAIGKFFLVLSLLPEALSGRVAEICLIEISPGISLTFKADQLGVFFALVASGLWILTSFYSIGYMRKLNEHKQTRYFSCFALSLSSTIGVAFSGNLLTFIIFYEILTISTYPLVIHKETDEAISAGRKYLAYTLSGGIILIIAIGWTYILTGKLDFVAGGFITALSGSEGTLQVLFALFIIGAGVKAALIPLHSWLPSAMVAPTPVSGLLHAVAVVKAGVFAILRIVGFVFDKQTMIQFGLSNFLAIVAGTTIIVASILAFREDNLKRRLAYSTISHLSYIALGWFLLAPSSLTGGLLHLASHATMKITLFFCAGAIYLALHKEKVSELDGIGKQMPFTMGAFAFTALGLSGVPPMNGFISKWYLGVGSLEVHQPIALIVLLLSGLLNAGYLVPIIHRSFFKTAQFSSQFNEAPSLVVVPLVITALLSVILGLFPDLWLHLFSLASNVAFSVLNGGYL